MSYNKIYTWIFGRSASYLKSHRCRRHYVEMHTYLSNSRPANSATARQLHDSVHVGGNREKTKIKALNLDLWEKNVEDTDDERVCDRSCSSNVEIEGVFARFLTARCFNKMCINIYVRIALPSPFTRKNFFLNNVYAESKQIFCWIPGLLAVAF
jgi:hypothetical protein